MASGAWFCGSFFTHLPLPLVPLLLTGVYCAAARSSIIADHTMPQPPQPTRIERRRGRKGKTSRHQANQLKPPRRSLPEEAIDKQNDSHGKVQKGCGWAIVNGAWWAFLGPPGSGLGTVFLCWTPASQMLPFWHRLFAFVCGAVGCAGAGPGGGCFCGPWVGNTSQGGREPQGGRVETAGQATHLPRSRTKTRDQNQGPVTKVTLQLHVESVCCLCLSLSVFVCLLLSFCLFCLFLFLVLGGLAPGASRLHGAAVHGTMDVKEEIMAVFLEHQKAGGLRDGRGICFLGDYFFTFYRGEEAVEKKQGTRNLKGILSQRQRQR